MRHPIGLLFLSQEGLNLITNFEGFEPEAYLDIGGVPTIGYGSTKDVKLGDRIDENGARNRLIYEVVHTYHPALNNACKVPLNQFEYDAYISLMYNIGAGAFKRSTLLKYLNKSLYDEAALQILRWNKVNDREVKGLTNRRKAEYQLCVRKING